MAVAEEFVAIQRGDTTCETTDTDQNGNDKSMEKNPRPSLPALNLRPDSPEFFNIGAGFFSVKFVRG